MKNLTMVFVTIFTTVIIIAAVAVIKFGMINVSYHTDHYVTTCNGVVVSTEDRNVTDSVDFDVEIKKSFNIFSR